MYMRNLWLIVVASIGLLSCEKDIDFDLEEQAPKLVVEASIENGQAPVVVLSQSFDYFSQIDSADLAGSFVRNAVIRVSNGSITHQLKEYAIPSPFGIFYYYSNDTTSSSPSFKGEEGKSYTMEIQVDGQRYTGTTTIPVLTKTVDSLWWKPSPNNPDTNLVVLMARVNDPKGFGNYIRFYTSTNGGNFFPGLNSVFDDQIVDGTIYDIEVEQGVDRNQEIDFETYSFFQRGDTVTVKFTNIDKATYDFWRTMEYNYGSIGNPFSSPTRVLGNISNGALGYFGGYAVQYRSLVIPK